MFKLVVAALMVLAAVTLVSAQYGSYITYCEKEQVTFMNFRENDCASGSYTGNYSKPLGGCHSELVFFSWNAACHQPNESAMQYYNYKNSDCSGDSVLTRTYTLGQCFNCPNTECKNP